MRASDRIPDEAILTEGERELWEWFLNLNAARQSGMNGPQPISSLEIKTWAEMSGAYVSRQEFAILRAMDAAYLSAYAAIRAEQDEERKARERAKTEALKRAG